MGPLAVAQPVLADGDPSTIPYLEAMPITRRHFLRRSTAAATAVALSPFLVAGKTPPPIRVGILGTGDRGTGLLNLTKEIPDLEVSAVCDLIPFRLEAARRASGAVAHTDWHRLIDDKTVEAVYIATPFGLHGEMALAALEAGKHVYCEKTMVRGIDSTNAVLAAAKARPNQIFQTGHQYHSSALYRELYNYVRQDYFGPITGVHCQWNRNHSWRRPVPADQPELERLINWRMYREHSGGMIAELMSHQIDFVNWISGNHPVRISGQGGIDYYQDGRETFDNVHLQMEYANGWDATFTCTTINKFGDYEIRILGKKATAILDYNDAKVYVEPLEPAEVGMVDGVSGATIAAWQSGEGVPVQADGQRPTLQALKQFAYAIQTGEQPESSVQTGALAAKCVAIGLEAARAGDTKLWKDYPALIG